MINPHREEHIRSLEFEMKSLSELRDKINKLLSDELSKKQAETLGIEITGHVMFLQQSLGRRAQALKERRD